MASARNYRIAFFVVFLISVIILLLFSITLGPSSELIAYVSLATSMISLIGMVLSQMIMWRKERRDSSQADFDLEKKKLEIEKLKLDIAGGRQSAEKKVKR